MKFLFLSSAALLPSYRSVVALPSIFRVASLTSQVASSTPRVASLSLGLASLTPRVASSTPRVASLTPRVASLTRLHSLPSELFDSSEDSFSSQNGGILRKKKKRNNKCAPMKTPYTPRGINQCRYVEYLEDPAAAIVLGVGPAGCGKTLFACYHAIQELKCGNIDKIVMTRPLVPVDKEELGFLPGTIVNKMDPWTRPIFDIFAEFFSKGEIEYMIKSGIIEISPLAYMRGRTFKNSFIIADEMQNSSPNQMLMMTTRIGEGSKMVITGDLKQSDLGGTEADVFSGNGHAVGRKLQTGPANGLYDFIQRIKNYKGENSAIRLVELDATDIERSPVVIKILELYEGIQP
jgi:phosphate starvation-inducible PhoH-like protein